MADPIPKAVRAKLEGLHAPYALIVFLDGKDAIIDIRAHKHQEFLDDYALWKKTTRPSLTRSDVRIFIKSPGTIREANL